MKSWKQLILCIVISVLATTFIGTVYFMIVSALESPSVALTIGAKLDPQGFKEEFGTETIEEALTMIYRNTQERLENTQEDFFNNNNENYPADYPVGGMLIDGLQLNVVTALFTIFILSIGIGITLGVVIYIIFIENKKGIDAIIAFFICLVLSCFLFKGAEMLAETIYGGYDFSWYNNIIIYVVTFILLYLINLIHQKKIANKLNRELNKGNKE